MLLSRHGLETTQGCVVQLYKPVGNVVKGILAWAGRLAPRDFKSPVDSCTKTTPPVDNSDDSLEDVVLDTIDTPPDASLVTRAAEKIRSYLGDKEPFRKARCRVVWRLRERTPRERYFVLSLIRRFEHKQAKREGCKNPAYQVMNELKVLGLIN